MPTVDYSKTIIYKIECENECYVGHTTNFINRKYQHKRECKMKQSNQFVYLFLYDKNWTMTPIEEFSCDNLTQARIREQYWIDKLKPYLNHYGAFYEYKYEKINCEICGGSYHNSSSHKKKHTETNKHKVWLKINMLQELRKSF
jgi:hypothetical protein